MLDLPLRRPGCLPCRSRPVGKHPKASQPLSRVAETEQEARVLDSRIPSVMPPTERKTHACGRGESGETPFLPPQPPQRGWSKSPVLSRTGFPCSKFSTALAVPVLEAAGASGASEGSVPLSSETVTDGARQNCSPYPGLHRGIWHCQRWGNRPAGHGAGCWMD